MIVRVGILVAASVAAYAVKQLNEKNSRSLAPRNQRSGILLYEFYTYQFIIFQADDRYSPM